jgi:hypothetical protein
MLEQSDITHYLLSLGLVKSRDVVEEDLTILDVSRRNCVFLATTRAGPAFVIKQGTVPTLAHEAAVLRALADADQLTGCVPVVVHHEPDAGLLVLMTPGGGRDWGEHHGDGRFPRLSAQTLGRLLAALGELPADLVESPPPDEDPLWGLSLPEPPRSLLLGLSAAAQDLVARVQASAELCGRLEALREVSCGPGLMHGDLRWDNCLAIAAPGGRRRTRVLLVDWELAGPGPAGYDMGTAIAEYLSLWVGSIPILAPEDTSRLVGHALHPLRRMQPAIHRLWVGYHRAGDGRVSPGRVVEFAGVRLLQTAVERAQGLGRPSAHVVTLLQLADNLLRRPDAAAAGLLGLR